MTTMGVGIMKSETHFGQWLERQINERGWNISELARRGEVSHVAILRVINGDRNAGPDLCRAIAKALEMPEEKVFRLAGHLSALPAPDDDLSFAEVYDMMKRLTPEERQEIMEYVEWRYRRTADKPSS